MILPVFSHFRLQKKYLPMLVFASSILSTLCIFPAKGQVSVNPSALNNLGPTTSGHKAPAKQKAGHTAKHSVNHPANHSGKQQNHHPASSIGQDHSSAQNTQSSPAPLPSIPAAPPPIPVFKDPELNVPLHPPAPPPMPKINPNVHGRVITTDQHTIIIFPADESELNETMMKAVMDFANILKQHPDTQVYLNAYSHGTQDDISTPRRNALNRGLAIRAVMINQGIPATRIYLVTKGIPEKTDPAIGADYVEMIRSDLINGK